MTTLDEVLIYIDDLQPITKVKLISYFKPANKAIIASAIARLRNRGDINYDLQSSSYRCTMQGSDRIIYTLAGLDNLRTNIPLNWYLCIFAIPEKNKVDREKLRTVLRQYGFGKLRGGLFIAHRPSETEITTMIARNRLEKFVSLIKIEEIARGYIEQYAPNAWPWKELEREYYAFISDANEFLKELRTNSRENQRILAKLLVYRLALVTRKDPNIEFLPSSQAIPREQAKKLYFTLKPFCYK